MAELAEQLKLLAEAVTKNTEFMKTFVDKVTAGSTSTVTVKSEERKEIVLESLANSISEFSFNAESGVTFEAWFSRYQDLFELDCNKLEDGEKVRLLLRKLNTVEHERYVNYILPKKPREITFEETVKSLKKLFGRQVSLFNMRYKCLQNTKSSQEDFISYASKVNRACEDFNMNELTVDQFKCLIFILGLRSQEEADIRTKLLSKLDAEKATITLSKMVEECELLRNLKSDAALVQNETKSAVNFVGKAKKSKNFNKSPDKKQQKPSIKPSTQSSTSENSKSTPNYPCWRCGSMHFPSECDYTDRKCHKCNKTGHKAGYCACAEKQKKFQESKFPKKKAASNVINVNSVSTKSKRKYVTVKLNDVPVKLQVDTGSDITIISRDSWFRIHNPTLSKSMLDAKDASKNQIQFLGEFNCSLQFENSSYEGKCYVSENNGINLLGIDFIEKLGLFEKPLDTVCHSVRAEEKAAIINKFKTKYPTLFSGKLGKCTHKVKFHLKPNSVPVFCPRRPVAFSMIEQVDQELNRLKNEGIITPVEYSDWAAPIVCVRKPNGKIRICADYSTGLNDCLEPHHHPIPTTDDMFSEFAGKEVFSSIDLTDAFLQYELDETTKDYLTIATHRGLFRQNRMPPGAKPAPGKMQESMEKILVGIPGVKVFFDDIAVASPDFNTHLEAIKEVFRRLEAHGFTLKLEKCKFFQAQITFLGFVVDKNGIHPNPAKIEKIKSMPAPVDKSQLRSLLGSLNYYQRFVPEMKKLRAPLDNLLKNETPFKWSNDCQKSFEFFKDFLSSDLLLTHYDAKLPIIVAADASSQGLGATIMHKFPDGKVKVIQHASRSLSPPEKNYSQIEKEGLALVFAIKKFHRFIYGRPFTLQTDHRPLLSIFGSKKGIPVYSASRLQRWALLLLNYDFKIEYINTKDFGYADVLSRLIDLQQKPEEEFVVASIQLEEEVENIIDLCQSNIPVSFKVIQSLTNRDSELQQVIKFVQTAWPAKEKISPNLLQYYNRQESLSVVKNCLMHGERIVVPSKLRSRIVRQVHRGHPGIVNMKAIARGYVYWPNIDKQLEDYVKSCNSCQNAAKSPTKTVLHSWSLTEQPFERIHIDYAGPIQGKHYLCIVDSFTKWPEVYPTNSTSSAATINCLRDCFARFGNPSELISDNATGFTSDEFKIFCEENGVIHKTIAPFHPQSNGQAERFVDTFKRALKKMEGEGRVDEIIHTFLQVYRSTPNRSSQHGKSPAEAMLGRKIRTKLDLLLPSKQSEFRRNKAQENQFNKKHGAIEKTFIAEDSVSVLRHYGNKTNWKPGMVIERIGNVMYNVLLNDSGKLVRVHANQLRKIPNPEIPSSKENSTSIPLNILLDDFQLSPNPNPIPTPTPVNESVISIHSSSDYEYESINSDQETDDESSSDSHEESHRSQLEHSSTPQSHQVPSSSQQENQPPVDDELQELRRGTRVRKPNERFHF